MKLNLTLMFVAVLISTMVGPAALGQEVAKDRLKNRVRVSKEELRFGTSARVMRAIEIPDLAKPTPTIASMAPALNRVAATGANSVCFNLFGLSSDGRELSKEGADAVQTALVQVSWRRLGAICRVFAPDAPADPQYRLAAARAAARALKEEVRMVYWIDGPNCTDLAAAFSAEAPNLVVAAREGGAVQVVTEESAGVSGQPVLLAGALPRDPAGPVHCVLPPEDASFAAMDAALADPIESQPWIPDNSVLTAQERDEGWISLFNGTSLDGWWVAGFNKEGFEARDGVIEWVRPGASMLMTHDRYDNFILRVECKIKERGNSGISVRVPRAGRASKIGMEIQVMGDYGTACTPETTAAVYDVVPPAKNASKPAGEWNAFEITLDGPKLTVVLNGEVVQDLNLDDNEELKYRLREGFIGLQDHGGPVSFRNIRVKRL